MNWTTHALYLIIILSLSGLVNKWQDNYKEVRDEYYKVYDKYLDLQLKEGESMIGWSNCLREHADETHMRTVCDNQLYDLRDWLRKCKCKCTGFEGK